MVGSKKIDAKGIENELEAVLKPAFPGVVVEVGCNDRWDRMCVTFRWAGFETLLPEERFHRLMTVIPVELRERSLAGFVWLELAPHETLDSFVKLPRSEDIAPREATVYRGLAKAGFFEALEEPMGPSPKASCGGDFSRSLAVLAKKKFSEAKVREAKLVFIRHRAFCDCQVLLTALPALTQAYERAAG